MIDMDLQSTYQKKAYGAVLNPPEWYSHNCVGFCYDCVALHKGPATKWCRFQPDIFGPGMVLFEAFVSREENKESSCFKDCN